MPKISLMLLFATLLMATTSCQKKKMLEPAITSITPADTPVNTKHYDDYMALRPGNYWVYNYYELDSINGEAHPEGAYDSVYVGRDTVINFRKYHRCIDVGFNIKGCTTTYLRDSLSYTVNHAGYVMFSSEDFTNLFRSETNLPNPGCYDDMDGDTLQVTEKMGLRNETTVVDAGTFTTSAFRRIHRYAAPFSPARIRSVDYRYAKNIGLVRQTVGIDQNGPTVFEKRLVRYHVQ